MYMDDYISREAAIRALEFRCKILTVRGGKTAADILTRYGIKTIRNRDSLPAADVRPVVYGEWILDSDPGEPWRYRCSKCGEITKDTCMGKPRANWCPNGGADMREVKHETTDR
jgi:hypothetical protein